MQSEDMGRQAQLSPDGQDGAGWVMTCYMELNVSLPWNEMDACRPCGNRIPSTQWWDVGGNYSCSPPRAIASEKKPVGGHAGSWGVSAVFSEALQHFVSSESSHMTGKSCFIVKRVHVQTSQLIASCYP